MFGALFPYFLPASFFPARRFSQGGRKPVCCCLLTLSLLAFSNAMAYKPFPGFDGDFMPFSADDFRPTFPDRTNKRPGTGIAPKLDNFATPGWRPYRMRRDFYDPDRYNRRWRNYSSNDFFNQRRRFSPWRSDDFDRFRSPFSRGYPTDRWGWDNIYNRPDQPGSPRYAPPRNNTPGSSSTQGGKPSMDKLLEGEVYWDQD